MPQNTVDAGGEVIFAVVPDRQATPAQQMGETGLMHRVIEAPIGRPPVAHEGAREVAPQDRGGLLEAAARQNGVDGGVRRGKGPEPVQLAADFPPGFVRTDDLALPDLCAQRLVGGAGAIGGAVQRVHEAAGRDVQRKAIAKQPAALAKGRPSWVCRTAASVTACGPSCAPPPPARWTFATGDALDAAAAATAAANLEGKCRTIGRTTRRSF